MHEGGLVARSEYHDIVPDERIVYTTALFAGEVLSTVSLTTVRFARDGDGTRLLLTEQGTFLVESTESVQSVVYPGFTSLPAPTAAPASRPAAPPPAPARPPRPRINDFAHPHRPGDLCFESAHGRPGAGCCAGC